MTKASEASVREVESLATRTTGDLVKAAMSGWLGTTLEFMDFQLYSLAAAPTRRPLPALGRRPAGGGGGGGGAGAPRRVGCPLLPPRHH